MGLAIKKLVHERRRYLLIGGIVLLLMFMVLFLSGLVNGLGRAVSSAVETSGATHYALSDTSEDLLTVSSLDESTYDKIASQTAAEVAPLDVTRMYLKVSGGDDEVGVAYFGIEPGSFEEPSTYEGTDLSHASSDVENPVVLDEQLAEKGIAVGDTVRDSTTGVEFTVVGFARDAMYSHVPVAYMSTDTYEKVMSELQPGRAKAYNAVAIKGTDDQVSGIDVDGIEVAGTASVVKAIPGYQAEQTTITMVEWVLVVITAAVIAIFFYIITIQKEREYGVMKALGVGTRRIAAHICLQVLVVSVLGAAIAAALVAWMSGMLPASMPFYLQAGPAAVVMAAFVAISLLGGLASVARVARVDPVRAIGGEE